MAHLSSVVYFFPPWYSYRYRSSVFKREKGHRWIILQVNFRLSKYPCYKLDYDNIRSRLIDLVITLPLVRNTIIAVRRET